MKKRLMSSIAPAVIITLIVLVILIYSGPAQALILGFNIVDDTIAQGDDAKLMISIKVETGEYLDLDYIELILNKTGLPPNTINCKFKPDSTPISGCTNMTIEVITLPSYMYGYGYGKGNLKYRIIFDSTGHDAGLYNTKYIVHTKTGGSEEKPGENLLIRANVQSLAGCSIRGVNGDLEFKDGVQIDFSGKNKMNFNIPLGNARNGKGTLIAQKGRDRLLYKFEIVDVLENNEHYAKIQVIGEYRLGRDKEKDRPAIIELDKDNNIISMSCTKIHLDDMDAKFMRGC